MLLCTCCCTAPHICKHLSSGVGVQGKMQHPCLIFYSLIFWSCVLHCCAVTDRNNSLTVHNFCLGDQMYMFKYMFMYINIYIFALQDIYIHIYKCALQEIVYLHEIVLSSCWECFPQVWYMMDNGLVYRSCACVTSCTDNSATPGHATLMKLIYCNGKFQEAAGLHGMLLQHSVTLCCIHSLGNITRLRYCTACCPSTATAHTVSAGVCRPWLG